MKFQNEIFSRVLNKDDYDTRFKEITHILDRNQCKEVEILFGVAWGNEYKDWTPFKVSVHHIAREIHSAEQLNAGRFGADDFFIIINEYQTGVLFCHEMDIHLRYNQANPIVEQIRRNWEIKDLIHSMSTGNS
jgi:hypothetical protein